MDCRGPLSVVLGLALVAAGCTPQSTLPLAPAEPATPPVASGLDAAKTVAEAATSSAPKDLPKITPKPATLVALGDFRAQQADDPTRSPREQELLRDQARKCYQHALMGDPDSLPASQGLARLYIGEKDYGRAESTYQKALGKHPKQASLWYELGMCRCRQKQWDAALECLRKAVELEPESRLYVNALGYCLARAGHYDESLDCFLKVSPPAQAHYNLARMLLHLNEGELARKHLEEATQVDPDLAGARELLAQFNGAPGSPPDAGNPGIDGPGLILPAVFETVGDGKP
jgi:tetratricopeptide (TPR) repeat protein